MQLNKDVRPSAVKSCANETIIARLADSGSLKHTASIIAFDTNQIVEATITDNIPKTLYILDHSLISHSPRWMCPHPAGDFLRAVLYMLPFPLIAVRAIIVI